MNQSNKIRIGQPVEPDPKPRDSAIQPCGSREANLVPLEDFQSQGEGELRFSGLLVILASIAIGLLVGSESKIKTHQVLRQEPGGHIIGSLLVPNSAEVDWTNQQMAFSWSFSATCAAAAILAVVFPSGFPRNLRLFALVTGLGAITGLICALLAAWLVAQTWSAGVYLVVCLPLLGAIVGVLALRFIEKHKIEQGDRDRG